MRTLLATLFLFSSMGCLAQLDSVYAQVYYQDDGTVPGYPCGFTTYRIYAQLSAVNMEVSSVFSTNFEEADLFIGAQEGSIWNSSFGGNLGSEMNPSLYEVLPKVEYDSFVTIGRESAFDGGDQLIYNMDSDELLQLQASFGIPPDTQVDPSEDGDLVVFGEDLEYLWTAGWTAVDGFEPSANDGPILLAQITTDGVLDWRLNMTVRETVDGSDTTFEFYHPHLDPNGGGTYGETKGLVGSIYDQVTCGVYCYLPADFDQSGIVDVPDALSLLAQYGCQEGCSLDLDGDDQVQTSDLLILLAQLWFGCDD